RCGNSSKCWNTMPTRLRTLGRSVLGSVTAVPSTTMRPFCTGSSAFTVLMSVDLPEPDGPHTTTTSPLRMLVVQSVRTWKVPYHLETFSMSIMLAMAGLSSADDGDLLLQALDDGRQREADDEIQDGRREVRLHRAAVVLAERLEAVQQVVGTD